MAIIMFCALMTTVAVELIIESAKSLASRKSESGILATVPLACVGVGIFSKFVLFLYCFTLRRYPAAQVFFVDHRNDLAVNIFSLIMSIVGDNFVWYLDPQTWHLVGKCAPREFMNKCIYVTLTPDERIEKVDTMTYHAGQQLYVEVDIITDPGTKLRDSHDINQTLQHKLEGLADIERTFVHVDYDYAHDMS
ncbi:hypothetical protein EYZ11_001722 [Aspergillus tanneri]|uniref:Cation efflux protein cytoplasmic domain-containing protein n=1 Tax=Aspergillus tanneri TaxID=1220188 RepID=A0A4V3UQE7_9EURO|nr:hypothetical protein EYZ11_001722 [Aspergillus tanneri]